MDIGVNGRLKEIRNHFNKGQQEFGKQLGVSRDVISNYELNRVEIKDYFIKLICLEFNINEKWLRTGDGEMLRSEEEGRTLAEFVVDIKMGKNKRLSDFIDSMAALSENELERLLDGIEIIKKMDI